MIMTTNILIAFFCVVVVYLLNNVIHAQKELIECQKRILECLANMYNDLYDVNGATQTIIDDLEKITNK